MEDWRYELAGLTAQERRRAVKVYEAVADRLVAGDLRTSLAAELRSTATAAGLDDEHPWIEAAARELELLESGEVRGRLSPWPLRPLDPALLRRHASRTS